MICANCNGTVETNFCPTCGQKSEIHRISLSHVVHEGVHSITHADKGFLLLVKELVMRPGFVAKEYIAGKRKHYFNPLSFLVITSALLAYFGTITGFMDALTSGGNRPGRQVSEEMKEAYHVAAHSGKWLTLLLIAPLFALLSWLFFFKKKYNYAENLVLHAFVFGEAAIFRMLVFIPLYMIIPEKTGLINLLVYEPIFISFLIVSYKQFFEQHIAWVIIKVILVRFLFLLLFWIVIYGYVLAKHLII